VHDAEFTMQDIVYAGEPVCAVELKAALLEARIEFSKSGNFYAAYKTTKI
jgi:hypothetical protein